MAIYEFTLNEKPVKADVPEDTTFFRRSGSILV
ncbi:hypothetical protein N752_25450 [Desulforamulus aquiferis]|nr:hypothetical protein N752_25450 [Desulforamulus aquiferis]